MIETGRTSLDSLVILSLHSLWQCRLMIFGTHNRELFRPTIFHKVCFNIEVYGQQRIALEAVTDALAAWAILQSFKVLLSRLISSWSKNLFLFEKKAAEIDEWDQVLIWSFHALTRTRTRHRLYMRLSCICWGGHDQSAGVALGPHPQSLSIWY